MDADSSNAAQGPHITGMFAILIALSLGGAMGRILAVNSVDQVRLEQHMRKDHNQPDRRLQRPFLSGNDRSRWLTIRALVERGTFAIDDLVCEPNWDTIDMVQHQDAQGKWRLYSSKPALLPVLMAGQYAAITSLTQTSLASHPHEIGRVMLMTWNLIPWWILLVTTGSVICTQSRTIWASTAAMALLCFGTLLSPFLVVLNNHLHAAAASSVCIWCLVKLHERRDDSRIAHWFLLGVSAALAFASELPAAALFPVLAIFMLRLSARRTLLYAAPSAGAVLAAYFGLNFYAHGDWSPPYAHRSDGPLLKSIAVSEDEFAQVWKPSLEQNKIPQAAFELSNGQFTLNDHTVVEACLRALPGTKWNVKDPTTGSRARLVRSGGTMELRAWNDWYDYEYRCGGTTRQSYWRNAANQAIIDQGEPDRWRYAFHCLLGHHGLFSLTPAWLLLPWAWLRAGGPTKEHPAPSVSTRQIAGITVVLTVICFAFYLSRPLVDRNYGGTSSALRWMLWLIPFWIVSLPPALDQAASSAIGRRVVYLLLGLSMVSASYPTWNPWTHPWIANFLNYLGWIKL